MIYEDTSEPIDSPFGTVAKSGLSVKATAAEASSALL
jgi:hypothetical protein